MSDFLQSRLDEHVRLVEGLGALSAEIQQAGDRLARCLGGGQKVLWMGNGGSAADAQHLAAELVGRFTRERRGLPSIALTTDTSILTAVGNDYGFETIFARQIEALCCRGDVVVGLSTSGRSANVLRGIERARAIGAFTIGLTGAAGEGLARLVDLALPVPSTVTHRIQEAHILIGHLLCEIVDERLAHA